MVKRKFSPLNVLVTGGTGFIGSHLIEGLLKNNINVFSTHLSLNPNSYFMQRKLYKKVTLSRIDITNFELIFDFITKKKIDYIYHLAAQPLVEIAYENPMRTYASNIMGTINILESVRHYKNIKAVVVASSDKAYGRLYGKKYKEDHPLQGIHPYEVSKSSTDLIANSYVHTYGLPVITTRFGNVYGEGDLNFSRTIPGIMKSIIQREKFEIRSNGKYVRDYLYVKDVVDGYLMLTSNLSKTIGHAFNFGSMDTFSVLEIIQLVEKTLKMKIPYTILNETKLELPYQSLDYSFATKTIGWMPSYTMRKTINKILTWYKKII